MIESTVSIDVSVLASVSLSLSIDGLKGTASFILTQTPTKVQIAHVTDFTGKIVTRYGWGINYSVNALSKSASLFDGVYRNKLIN